MSPASPPRAPRAARAPTGAGELRALLTGREGREGLLLDLSGALLAGADLSGLDLSGALLCGADLTGADLSGADLSGANLTLANLTGALLVGADLSFAHLEGAALHGCDLRGARLQRSFMSHALFTGGRWEGATLRGLPALRPEGAPRARRLCTARGAHALALEWGAHLPAEARALPPVVALHGMFGRPEELGALAALLGREVVALELFGHGERPCAPQRGEGLMSFEELAEEMGALVAAAADGRPFWLLGYSLGGRVALTAALAARGWGGDLLGLCLLGASPGLSPEEAPARLLRDEEWAARLERDDLREVLRDWSAQPLLAPPAARDPEAARERLAARAAQDPCALAWAARAWSVARMRPAWDDLGALSAPALWLHGAEDARYEEVAARAAARCPRGRAAAVAGASHAAHLDAPAEVASLLLGFMGDVERGR